MFIIRKKSTGELRVWANKRTDDFLINIGESFDGTTNEDIEIFLLPDSSQYFLKLDKYFEIREDVDGIFLDIRQKPTYDMSDPENPVEIPGAFIESLPTKSIDFPYNQNGEFVVPDEFIPEP